MKATARLIDVVTAVSDGAVVDWGRTESETSPAERHLIGHLRVLERVASVHAALPPIAAFERSLHDSLWHPAAAAEAPREDVPATWGSLTIIEHIGSGTSADVYRARDPRLDRPVALKLLRHRDEGTAVESEAIEEARLLARVEHPNVVAVYGADRLDGRVGIWMAFVEGRTLDQELHDGGPFPPGEVARVGIALCGALGAVHKAGLLHRDIKAQNVLRDREGRVLLADFGTGREVAKLAAANELAGTPLYLAPEVLRGERASAASDIYSLGVLLYHLSTGSFPVCGRSLFDLRDSHARGVRMPLDQARRRPPRQLAAAIDRATSLDPATRFQTVSQLEKALSTVGLHPRLPSRWAVGLAASLLVVGAMVWLLDAGGWRHRSQAAASQGVGPAPSAPTVHRTRLPEEAVMGPPSRDGRLFPYVDSGGNIAVFEVATGQSRRLTTAATSTEAGRSALMSPRGDRVVYEWAAPNHAFELRVADADGSWSGVLVSRSTAFEPVPLDWSRDGRQILCSFEQRNGTADLVLVPAELGTARVLVSLSGTIGRGSLSPDGRFAAYYAIPKGTSSGPPQKGLFIVGTDGSPPRLLMTAPKDGRPSWTPDGTSVFFVRNGFPVEPTDGWVVPVIHGVAGTPRLVAPNLGLIQDVTITDNGTLTYVKPFSASEVYTAPIDLSGGSPGAPTRISATNLDHHTAPTWSPDGTKVAFFVFQPHPYGYADLRTLAIKNLRSGAETALHPALSFLGTYPAQWLPDGRTVIVWGRDLDETHPDRRGFYRVDTQTSETRPVVLVDPLGGPALFRTSRDGRALLYLDPKRGIVAHELATGRETIRIPRVAGSRLYVFGESPTENAIAFSSCLDNRCVLNVQTGDGPPRVLVSSPADDMIFEGWTPDGRQILYTRDPRPGLDLPTDTPVDLRLIPVTGGPSRSLHVPIFIRRGGRVDLSPDGRWIAYAEQNSFPELWAQDGVVPGLTAVNRVPKR